MDQADDTTRVGDQEGQAETDAAADMLGAPSGSDGQQQPAEAQGNGDEGGSGATVLHDADSDGYLQDIADNSEAESNRAFDDGMDRAEAAAEVGDTKAQAEAEGDVAKALADDSAPKKEGLDLGSLLKNFAGSGTDEGAGDERNAAIVAAANEYKDGTKKNSDNGGVQRNSKAEEYKSLPAPKYGQRRGRGGQEFKR